MECGSRFDNDFAGTGSKAYRHTHEQLKTVSNNRQRVEKKRNAPVFVSQKDKYLLRRRAGVLFLNKRALPVLIQK